MTIPDDIAKVAHDFDWLTEWCLRCGQGRADVVDQRLTCTDAVIPISHLVRGQALRRLSARIGHP